MLLPLLIQPKYQFPAGHKEAVCGKISLENPELWGPPPTQVPNQYVAITKIYKNREQIDYYETRFGIRSLKYDANSGVYVNEELIKLKGVNQHHDLGALGAAFNIRAAERQLEILQEMGCNAFEWPIIHLLLNCWS